MRNLPTRKNAALVALDRHSATWATPRYLHLLVLICALSLGLATTIGNATVRNEVAPPSDLLRAGSTTRVASEAQGSLDLPRDVAIHSSNGRPFKLIEDVAWDDPDGDDDETDEPISCYQELGLWLTGIEFGSGTIWADFPSFPFFASQRLRC